MPDVEFPRDSRGEDSQGEGRDADGRREEELGMIVASCQDEDFSKYLVLMNVREEDIDVYGDGIITWRDEIQPEFPKWSPSEGFLIAYGDAAQGKIRWLNLRSARDEVMLLFDHPAFNGRFDCYEPDWFPDRKIAARCLDKFADKWGIFAFELEADSPLEVMAGFLEDREASHPSVAPDGTRIAYQKGREGQTRIYIMNSPFPPLGRNGQEIVNHPLGNCRHPDWSSDGTRMAAVCSDNEETELFIIPVNGNEPRSILRGQDIAYPSWSHDDAHLAYSKRGRIYTVTSEGREEREIDNPLGGNCSAPDWQRVFL